MSDIDRNAIMVAGQMIVISANLNMYMEIILVAAITLSSVCVGGTNVCRSSYLTRRAISPPRRDDLCQPLRPEAVRNR